MNWKQEARDQLAAYEYSCNALRSMELLSKQLEMELYGTPGQKLDAPIRGSGGDYEDYRLNRLVKLESLRSRMQQTKTWVDAMDHALQTVTPEERMVLARLYIHPQKGALDQLCQELNMERTTAYRMRDKSLERFTLALYGIDQ